MSFFRLELRKLYHPFPIYHATVLCSKLLTYPFPIYRNPPQSINNSLPYPSLSVLARLSQSLVRLSVQQPAINRYYRTFLSTVTYLFSRTKHRPFLNSILPRYHNRSILPRPVLITVCRYCPFNAVSGRTPTVILPYLNVESSSLPVSSSPLLSSTREETLFSKPLSTRSNRLPDDGTLVNRGNLKSPCSKSCIRWQSHKLAKFSS